MSYSTIMALWPGTERIEYWDEFRNSHGTATHVWDAMFNRYCQKKHEYDSWLSRGNDKEFWNLANREDIPMVHRTVFALTFDGAYIAAEHFEKAANDIERFFKDFPVKPTYVNHWPAIISFLRSKPECPAVGFYWTSCGENFWKRSYFHKEEDGDIDEDRPKPFDWSKAWSLYEEMTEPIEA
jgi:hypothetical protein